MSHLSFLAATTTFLSLVNEAQYLLINRASVQLIQELTSSRFQLPVLYINRDTQRCFHIYIVFCDLWECSMSFPHIKEISHFRDEKQSISLPFLRQEDSVADQQLNTKNITSRFRANLVIAGGEAFEEDNWSQLMIGNTHFVVRESSHARSAYFSKVKRFRCDWIQRWRVGVEGATWLEWTRKQAPKQKSRYWLCLAIAAGRSVPSSCCRACGGVERWMTLRVIVHF